MPERSRVSATRAFKIRITKVPITQCYACAHHHYNINGQRMKKLHASPIIVIDSGKAETPPHGAKFWPKFRSVFDRMVELGTDISVPFQSSSSVPGTDILVPKGFWNCSSSSSREWNYFFSSVQKMACTVELFVPELELFLPPSMTP